MSNNYFKYQFFGLAVIFLFVFIILSWSYIFPGSSSDSNYLELITDTPKESSNIE